MKMNRVVRMMKQWSNKLPMFLTSVPDQMSLQHMSYIRRLKKEMQRDYFQHPFDELEVVVFDFETSGFLPEEGDQILSVGAVKVKGIELSEESFYSCVYTDTPPPNEILDLTGLSMKELHAAPPIQQVLPDFLSFSANSMLVAHHARHEMAFLRKASQLLWSTSFEQKIVDTSFIIKLFQSGGGPTPSLDSCCKLFNIIIDRRHHALGDAMATAKLWIAYIKEFKQRKLETLQDVYHELAKTQGP